jgi:hypothetical protein
MTKNGPSESDVSPQIVQAVQATGCQLWRNNSGVAKFGPRWVRYGVGKGGSDHIGYLPVRVTEAMVGQIIAVFVAVESKRPKGAEYTQDQIDFIANVKAAGGIAGFAHSWEQGRAIFSNWFARFAKKPNGDNE